MGESLKGSWWIFQDLVWGKGPSLDLDPEERLYWEMGEPLKGWWWIYPDLALGEAQSLDLDPEETPY
jgi:hypothetical protein